MPPTIETRLAPPRAAPFDGAGRRGIIEIGPHDLPPPEGGYEDFVLDEDAPAASTPTPAPAAGPPATPPRISASASTPAGLARARATRWLLFPEALVVAGFVLIGLFLAGLTYWTRTVRLAEPGPAAAREGELAPLLGGAPPPPPLIMPLSPDVAALAPEPPPEPGLAPSAIEQLLPVPSDAPDGPPPAPAVPAPDRGADLAER